MKARVNDPCPCGSGRKYKKCCLHLDSPSGTFTAAAAAGLEVEMQTALSTLLSMENGLPSAALHMPPPKRPSTGYALETVQASIFPQHTALAPLPWPALPKDAKGFISRAEEANVLQDKHIAFQTYIAQCFHSQTDARVGLQALALIPREDAMRLEWYGAAKAYLLELLDLREEALYCQLEQMLEVQDEALWYTWGMRGLQWLQTYPKAPQRPEVLQALQETCQKTTYMAPKLLSTFVMWEQSPPQSNTQTTPPPEAVAAMCSLLQAELWPWRRKRIMRNPGMQQAQGEWMAAIGDGLSRLLYHLHTTAQTEAWAEIVHQCHLFPWQQLHPKYRQHTLRALCSAFAIAQRFDEILRLCKSFATWMPDDPVVHVWSGFAYHKSGESEQATRHLEKAAKHPASLTDAERICIIDQAFARQKTASMMPLLQSLHEQASLEVVRLYYWYHHLRQEHDAALPYIEQWLAYEPEQYEAICRRIRTLEMVQTTEQWEAELQPLLESPSQELQQFACIYLGIHQTMRGQWPEALSLFNRLPAQPDDAIFLDDALFACHFWSCYGKALEQDQRWPEAEEKYRRALQQYPLDWTYARLLTGLAQQAAWTAIEELLPQALIAAPDDFAVLTVQLQLWLQQGKPEEARQTLEVMGRDIFLQHHMQREWLWCWIRTLIELDSPREALQFCELHLSEILQDDTLTTLRSELFEEVMAQMQELEQQVGLQHQQIQETESLRKRLLRKSEESQRSKQAMQHMLQEQNSLRIELEELQQSVSQRKESTSPNSEASIQRWIQEAHELLSQMHPNEQKIVCNAERLWQQLHEDDDHAPVVLQLARVVEGEINQRLIDPLVALALAQGHALSQLPTITLGRLKPHHNRLSLGDACKLLYYKFEQSEPDGTQSTIINPASSAIHRAILADFWAVPARAALPPSTIAYLQGPVITAIKRLTLVRNQASHAGKPIGRDTVMPIRLLVLGDGQMPGILHQLVRLPSSQNDSGR